MTSAEPMQFKDVGDSYLELVGQVPPGIADRLRLAQATGRETAIQAIEQMREELLHRNPLDRRTQQLVQFGMLVAMRASDAARLHAAGAIRAGATLSDLQGVAETAAVVAGMPGFSLAVELIAELAPTGGLSEQRADHHTE